MRIYFATGLVDMRNGINGLRTIVEQVLKRNPDEGHPFVFVGKRRDISGSRRARWARVVEAALSRRWHSSESKRSRKS